MTASDGTPQSTPTRKTGAQSKQAATWLTPEQIETIRDTCLSNTFPTYLPDRNETIITVLADTGLRVSELVALDWDYLNPDAESPELILPGSFQTRNKRDAYLDLDRETARQLRRYWNRVWKETPAMFPSRQSERMSKISVRRMVKKAVQVFLYFIVLVVGLDTLQVDVEILYISASAVAGGLGLALTIGLGIALGLGGRDYVAENIDDWAGKASTEMDSSDTRPETRGLGSSASGTDPDISD